MHERTEPPTAKRRQEAREEGRMPRSRDLAVAVSLLGGFVGLAWAGPRLGERALDLTRASLGQLASARGSLATAELGDSFGAPLGSLLIAAAPIALLAALAAVLGCVAQGAGRPLAALVLPRFGRMNPAQAWRRVGGVGSVFRGLFAGAKLVVVGMLLWTGVRAWMRTAGAGSPRQTAGELWDAAIGSGIRTALALTILAVLDYLVQRWLHERSMRMSPAEIREEALRDEGDPSLKSRRRRLHGAAARRGRDAREDAGR